MRDSSNFHLCLGQLPVRHLHAAQRSPQVGSGSADLFLLAGFSNPRATEELQPSLLIYTPLGTLASNVLRTVAAEKPRLHAGGSKSCPDSARNTQ